MNRCEKAHPITIFLFAALIIIPLPLSAQMRELGEDGLSSTFGQAGVSVNFGDFGVNVTASSIRISDTDHSPANWIELNNFSISGPGGSFKLDCPQDSPMLYDVGTMTTTGRTLAVFQLSDHTNSRVWQVGNFVFHNGVDGVDTDLGSITFDTSTVDPAFFGLSSHVADGTSGIEYEYLTKWLTNDFTYSYNTAGNSLNLHGIHLAEGVSGAPEDPSTWVFTGYYRIGDIKGGIIDVDNDPSNQAVANPASIDVGTDTTTSTTCIYLNLPMKGTCRVENVSIGGNSFGPVAIDGITAHHLYLKINPGN